MPGALAPIETRLIGSVGRQLLTATEAGTHRRVARWRATRCFTRCGSAADAPMLRPHARADAARYRRDGHWGGESALGRFAASAGRAAGYDDAVVDGERA